MGDDSFRPNHVYITKDNGDITIVELDHVGDFPAKRCFKYFEDAGIKYKNSRGGWEEIDPRYVPTLVTYIFGGVPLDELKKEYPDLTIVDNIAERATKKK